MKDKSFLISLGCISAALLSLEISLMRMLRVEGFGNFTYGAISLALTGFGATGTILCIFRERLKNLELKLCFWSATGFILFLGAGYYLSSLVQFDSLRILWDHSQLIHLLLRYLFYTIPFIIGSTFVVLSFTLQRPSRAYFFNLTGSGAGIIIILAGFYLLPPERILVIPLGLSLISVLFIAASTPLRVLEKASAISAILAGFIFFSMGDINPLPYKGKELTLNFPDARIIERRISPFGTIEVIESSKIRIAPGLSYAFQEELPQQHELFIDGDHYASIDRITGEHSMDYLLFQVQSAVYRIHRSPEVFIIGLEGGAPVERAMRNGASRITVAEENPYLPIILRDSFRDFNNSFFLIEGLEIKVTGARSYLLSSKQSFDIIELSVNEGLTSSIGGIYSADTTYNLTVDAFMDYLSHLKEGGTISATIPLRYPPRNLLKLVMITQKALRLKGLDPGECMVVIRGWSMGTVMLKTRPFSNKEIEEIKGFCKERMFDLVYYRGMTEEESNIYTIVPDAHYYRSVNNILKDDRTFSKSNPFNLKPVFDNNPYFFNFTKIGKLPRLLREIGREWLLVIEGGYIVLFATFIATLILSVIFILLPPVIIGERMGPGKISILIYFSLIAIGYMLIEVLLMQRYSKLIPNPLYSNSMVITALLISSGMGSYFSPLFSSSGENTKSFTWKKNPVKVGTGKISRNVSLLLMICFLSGYFLTLLFFYDSIFLRLLRAPMIIRLVMLVLITAPAGFAMGLFFPIAMTNITKRSIHSVPWAWSVNGFFSVLTSTGSMLIISATGLIFTGILAVCCYWIAFLFLPE
ncbi:MAG: hypothetical protein ACUVWJ_05070 [Spirochaetota bacterium]